MVGLHQPKYSVVCRRIPFTKTAFSKLMANVHQFGKIFKIPPELYNEQLGGSNGFKCYRSETSFDDGYHHHSPSVPLPAFVQHGFGNPVSVFSFCWDATSLSKSWIWRLTANAPQKLWRFFKCETNKFKNILMKTSSVWRRRLWRGDFVLF